MGEVIKISDYLFKKLSDGSHVIIFASTEYTVGLLEKAYEVVLVKFKNLRLANSLEQEVCKKLENSGFVNRWNGLSKIHNIYIGILFDDKYIENGKIHVKGFSL